MSATRHASRRRAIALTLRALPYYTVLPLATALVHLESPAREVRSPWHKVGLYLLLLELLVFLDHYYLLHRWKHLQHGVHHSFRTAEAVCAWVAFAFHPWDGLSQGMPVLYAAMVVPVAWNVVYATILAVGLWTVYIHTDAPSLPFPLMGCDYHRIHHQKNWYNFGLFTVTFDWLWGTLMPPTRIGAEDPKR